MGGPHGAAGGAPGFGFGVPIPGVHELNGAGLVAEAAPPRAIGRGEAAYPAGLGALPDAPARVFVLGRAVPPPGRCVAIVGSRAASPYGLERARRLAGDLAALGVTIVSGMARGIDAAAHRAALGAGGATVAVLPCGLDAIPGLGATDLAGAILARGTLLSEVAAGPPFGRGAFVRRNRLIAALSAATVVVEAAGRSGALSTAAAARALGRPVLAVPGDADRPTARGCLDLLRAGAQWCENAADVLAAAPPLRAAPPCDARTRVLASLGDEPRTVDAIARLAGVPVGEALAQLARLEWAGLARRAPGGRWLGGRA